MQELSKQYQKLIEENTTLKQKIRKLEKSAEGLRESGTKYPYYHSKHSGRLSRDGPYRKMDLR